MNIVEKIKEICPEGFDAYEFVNEVYNWPLIPELVEEEGVWLVGKDDNLEWLDVENFFIEELEEKHMIVVCGGDWQTPHKLRIELLNDNLEVTSDEEITDEDYEYKNEIILDYE